MISKLNFFCGITKLKMKNKTFCCLKVAFLLTKLKMPFHGVNIRYQEVFAGEYGIDSPALLVPIIHIVIHIEDNTALRL